MERREDMRRKHGLDVCTRVAMPCDCSADAWLRRSGADGHVSAPARPTARLSAASLGSHCPAGQAEHAIGPQLAIGGRTFSRRLPHHLTCQSRYQFGMGIAIAVWRGPPGPPPWTLCSAIARSTTFASQLRAVIWAAKKQVLQQKISPLPIFLSSDISFVVCLEESV
ncbi:hypothetical protein CC85DRAFT_198688 [Cutaneotrichosporon oleaginosum]|uniref:Uncharacterized protein n=1 Tax=Cutaneotrichosporon oleaginosum TaxID=879819 RepID=A0A0J0XDY1_9TREE|nr:uncharacterized protein CC85DRAFT_198688 [Cutaneotrichosporon oleaginosum]KLT39301.1 hypothetical protein CC85DRAFT_198688 [Cutaneotrichosporon oleaginosum]TXT08558.1 hypothetical protein COLE_05482 [Cutaneotrichosporon oleaginosum]